MDCTLLINATEAFPRIMQHIRQARTEIIISMFVWRDDAIGNKIAESLLEAADRGVRVRIIKDKLAAIHELAEENRQSFFHPQGDRRLWPQQLLFKFLYFRYLGRKQKAAANPMLKRMQQHPNIMLNTESVRSDHSKFYLIDNCYLILGGINIEDKELAFDKRHLRYADYMIEVRSAPLVQRFRNAVIDETVSNLTELHPFYINQRKNRVRTIKPKLLELFERAEQSIDIEMAYWGDREINARLVDLAHKGIRISVITSRASNLQNDFNLKTMAELMRKSQHKIRVYLSQRVVHSKFVCIDKRILFLGSANFNRPGMNKLSELNILIKDDEKAIHAWQSWRDQHLEECVVIKDYRQIQFNRFVAALEGLFC